jgi:hypothetical protein
VLKFCVVSPDADLREIEAKLCEMRTRQLLTVIPSTAADIGKDIDALIGMWQAKHEALA